MAKPKRIGNLLKLINESSRHAPSSLDAPVQPTLTPNNIVQPNLTPNDSADPVLAPQDMSSAPVVNESSQQSSKH